MFRNVAITLTALILSAPSFSATFHVMIDPGHGGIDSGAVAHGVREADVALQVSRLLAKRLVASGDFEVSMTRVRDSKLSLNRRAEIANGSKADLFISIHANSSPDARARGAEFYFQNQLPPSEEELFLAARENESLASDGTPIKRAKKRHKNKDIALILEDLERSQNIVASYGMASDLAVAWKYSNKKQKKSIRQAPFYLVSNVDMPSVLVELGYVSHPRESQKLLKRYYQKRLVEKLHTAITKFKERMDKAL